MLDRQKEIKKQIKRAKKVGRSLKFGVEEFAQTTEQYLADCVAENKLPFLTGLALRLGIDEDTVTQYSKRPAYARAVKRVKEVGKEMLINKLMTTEKPLVNHIFLAKAIAGLRDNADLGNGSVFEVRGVVALPKRGKKL